MACGEGCALEHEHLRDADGDQMSLYGHVDFSRSTVLNANGSLRVVLRPWAERELDQDLKSDVDEQMLLKIQFTGLVKLRSISLTTQSRDVEMSLYINKDTLDFSDVDSLEPVQKFDLVPTQALSDLPEYFVKPVKFTAVNHLSIFITSRDLKTNVGFLSLKGDFTKLTQAPVHIVYEAQANPADHPKVKAMTNGALL